MTLETMKKLTPEDMELSSLVDIGTIRIDPSLPAKEKLTSYLEQILKDYCLLTYNDYQRWKHNYPNINLFELVFGRKVDLETVLRTYQAFLNDQDDTSHDDNQPDAL